MVWYVPPLSPFTNVFEGKDMDGSLEAMFPAISQMRIPLDYLTNLLSAGDKGVIMNVLQKIVVMRHYMRAKTLGKMTSGILLEKIGMTPEVIEEMYRLLAIAKYEDRFVIPPVLEKKSLKYRSMMFHIGILFVFLGHIAGLLIPKSFMEIVGVSEAYDYFGAVYGGGLSQVRDHRVPVVIALHHHQRIVVFLRQHGDACRQLLRWKMTAQLGDLHAAAHFDHLRAGIIALCSAARGIHADDILLGRSPIHCRDWRKERQQLPVIGLLARRHQLLHPALDDVHIKHAIA